MAWESLFKRNGRGYCTAVPPLRGPEGLPPEIGISSQLSKSKTDTFFVPEWLPSLFL